MRLTQFDHHEAKQIIPENVLSQVKIALRRLAASEYRTVPKLRAKVLQELGKYGWSKAIRVSPDSKITITARNGDAGLCVQTGNMGRFYADLLKLQLMYQEHAIRAAIYVTLCRPYARELNSNLVVYERLTDELRLFSNIITVPINVIGMGG